METMITATVGGIIISLFGFAWRAQTKKIEDIATRKTDYDVCVEKHKAIDEKFARLFDKLDSNNELLNTIYTDVAIVKRCINGK